MFLYTIPVKKKHQKKNFVLKKYFLQHPRQKEIFEELALSIHSQEIIRKMKCDRKAMMNKIYYLEGNIRVICKIFHLERNVRVIVQCPPEDSIRKRIRETE